MSHLPIKKAYHMGYMGPVPQAPYWLATEIVTIPYGEVMVTDGEAKDLYGMPIPFKS